jgi:alpha-L-fucosidase
MKIFSVIISMFLAIILFGCNSGKQSYQPKTDTFKSLKGTEIFQPDSASIAANYKIPEWFRDAKFGIL